MKLKALASAVMLATSSVSASEIDFQLINELQKNMDQIDTWHLTEQEDLITHSFKEGLDISGAGTTANTSYFSFVSTLKSETLRLKYAKRFKNIYLNAIENSQKLINKIESYSETTRDYIKQQDWYQRFLDRIEFYQQEVQKFDSLLNGETKTLINTTVTTETIKEVPDEPFKVRLLDTFEKTLVLEENGQKNTYSVVYEKTDYSFFIQEYEVTTETKTYSDGTSVSKETKTLLKAYFEHEYKTEEVSRTLVSSERINAVNGQPIYTQEFNENYGLALIGAGTAYEQGYTGAGVRVAVIDTGITDADNQLNIVAGWNTQSDTSDYSDANGHGTHVAGIIGAKKDDVGIHGVAYNAEIVAVRVAKDNGAMPFLAMKQGVDYAVENNAKIINMSIQSNRVYSKTTTPDSLYEYYYGDSYRNAVENGTLFVVAAGNSGYDCKEYQSTSGSSAGTTAVKCSSLAMLPYTNQHASLEKGWITVGAVDNQSEIASYSNKAGVMKDYYMVAPGSQIVSLDDDGGTTVKSGTSMAAPHVAGAAALLQEKFPNLSTHNIRDILLQTATDLGEEGVDEVYGHGLLNVDKAMAPIGDIKFSDGTQVETVTASNLPSVIGEAMVASGVFDDVSVQDDYNRIYTANLSNQIAVTQNTFSFDSYIPMSFEQGFNLGVLPNNIEGSSPFMLGYQFDNITFKYSYQEGIFGETRTALLEADTMTHHFGGTYQLGGLEFAGTYTWIPSFEGNGFIDRVSSIHSLGYSVFKTFETDETVIKFGVDSPSKIMKGTVSTVNYQYDAMGATVENTQHFDLASGDRQYHASLFMKHNWSNNTQITFNANKQLNEENRSLGIKLNYVF